MRRQSENSQSKRVLSQINSDLDFIMQPEQKPIKKAKIGRMTVKKSLELLPGVESTRKPLQTSKMKLLTLPDLHLVEKALTKTIRDPEKLIREAKAEKKQLFSLKPVNL